MVHGGTMRSDRRSRAVCHGSCVPLKRARELFWGRCGPEAGRTIVVVVRRACGLDIGGRVSGVLMLQALHSEASPKPASFSRTGKQRIGQAEARWRQLSFSFSNTASSRRRRQRRAIAANTRRMRSQEAQATWAHARQARMLL